MNMTETAPFPHYLPVEKDAVRWGLHVMDAGFMTISPNTSYPQGRHPAEYLFSWKSGRTLQEYQLVYITQGSGVFETAETGRVRIDEGQVFFLFPGIWHRYRPTRAKGWDQNWIGFDGEIAQRIMGEFFSPEKAVIRIGFNPELFNVIRSIPVLMQEAPAGYPQLMAARTIEALALIRSLAMNTRYTDRNISQKVQQARYYLHEHSAEKIDMEALAKELGLSYSRFRSMFKINTGTAPHQYLLNIRMNKAHDLLLYSCLSISDISERLGFSSAYYFSRLFKKRTGRSPSAHREHLSNLRSQ